MIRSTGWIALAKRTQGGKTLAELAAALSPFHQSVVQDLVAEYGEARVLAMWPRLMAEIKICD